MGSNMFSLENSEMAQAMRGGSDSAGLHYLRNMNFDIGPNTEEMENVPPDFVPGCATDSYQYPPLPSQRFSIRLIRLLPGVWDSPIELELVTVPMEAGKIPYYEAVSYVWGDMNPDLGVSISCGRCPMRIGRSAAMALRRFRFSDHVRLLWVDAICINQNDTLEKNQQVSKMDAIYQTASQVLVYLGEADHLLSDMAMDCISERRVVPRDDYSLQAAIQLFSRRQWFSRVWVLQEVALAEIALVICGSKCVPWACFHEWWIRNTSSLEGKAEIPPVLFYGPSVMKRPPLLQQLHDTRHSRATLALDKVYALIGLLEPADRAVFLKPGANMVDYSQTTTSLFVSVAKFIIEKTTSLQILSGRIEPSTSPRQEGLPSWVPDWSVPTSITSLGLANKYLEPYDAGGKPACGVKVHHPSSGTQQPPTLECLGTTFSVVKQVATNFIQPNADPAKDFQVLVREWIAFAALGLPDSSFEDRMANYLIGRFRAQYDNLAIKGDSNDPADPQTGRFWSTLQALSTPALELKPEELATRVGRAASIESLKFCVDRKLFVTESAVLGLGPIDIREGDTVAVLLGAPVPHILRRQPTEVSDSTNLYTLVGECFVDGIMAGEALNHLQDQLQGMGHRCRTFSKNCSTSALETFFLQ